MRIYVLAALVALLHTALAIVYASETPYRTPGSLMSSGMRVEIQDVGAPDEMQHANYVQHLLSGKGFPVFVAGSPDYESHQPPAYYLAAAAFARLVGVSDVASADGVRLRWLSGLIGFGTAMGVFCLALWGFGRLDVALAAEVFAALLPMHCALDGAISNDPLLFCACTWTMALLARAVATGWNWKLAIGVGLLAALALNTKTTAISLLPVIALGGFVGEKAPKRMLAAALAIGIGLAVPWWLRNNALYGDPLALKAFAGGFQNAPKTGDMIVVAGGPLDYWMNWFGWWTIRSFFGAFGYMDVFMNSSTAARPPAADHELLYRLMLIGFLVLSAGWLLALQKPEWKAAKPIQWINGAFLALIVLLFLRFNLTYFQAQGRYLYPAIGPIACGAGVGLCYWAKRRWELGVAALALLMLAVNIWALSLLPDAFATRTRALSSSSSFLGGAKPSGAVVPSII